MSEREKERKMKKVGEVNYRKDFYSFFISTFLLGDLMLFSIKIAMRSCRICEVAAVWQNSKEKKRETMVLCTNGNNLQIMH
jgi:hypothetical protein